jgi:ribosome maturation factor RimP
VFARRCWCRPPLPPLLVFTPTTPNRIPFLRAAGASPFRGLGGHKFGSNTSFPLPLQRNKNQGRERNRSLLLLSAMSTDGQIQALEQRINRLIQQEPDIFLVDIWIKPTNNVKVFLDSDQGMSIDRLIQYNRRLYRELEEETFFPGNDFSLEVSSPGLEEPLKLYRQYLKNIGRFVEVIQVDGIKKEGKLISADENQVIIEEEKGKGKKKEMVRHTIPFNQIKTTKIQIKF